jgi:hypothetical protein
LAGAALGLVVERWLLFAEAKHTVILCSGSEAVWPALIGRGKKHRESG